MGRKGPKPIVRRQELNFLLAAICILAIWWLTPVLAGGGEPATEGIRILDGKPKVIIVNGYSTSFRWPDLLQRKLDRYFDLKRVVEVKRATKGSSCWIYSFPCAR